jgi:photosystem II stability/assembly factor-like uncharacterized protein
MKKIVLFLSILFALSTKTNSQWYQIGDNPAGAFSIVKFADENIGWGCRNDPMKIFKTINGGVTWSVNFEPWAPITAIFFLDANHGWFSHVSGNLLYTSNGGESWTVRYPAQNWHMEDIFFSDTLNGITCGSSFGDPEIFKTTNGGAYWELVYTPSVPVYVLSFLNDSLGWCAGDSLYKTTDAGQNWTLLSSNVDGTILKMQFLNESVGWLSTFGGNNLYSTSDGGNSWNLKLTSINDFWFTDMNNGWYNTNGKIFYTTNNGISWEEQYSDTSNNLYSLYFMNPEFGWAVKSDGKVLHTINGGTPVELLSFSSSVVDNDVTLNWTTATETNNQGFQIERRKTQDERSDDWNSLGFVDGKGTTTEPQSYSFVDENLSAGKYQYRLKQIDFDGTFEYSNTIEIEINQPTKFSLEQNYPNPFNPSTKIHFTIPTSPLSPSPYQGEGNRERFVTLKVFDVLGKEVATLVNEEKLEGSYDIEFKSSIGSSQLASGIYYYQLRSGDYLETKKMILMK